MDIVIHDYTVTVADIPGGHRLTATRGSEVQTIDVMSKSGGGTGGSGTDGFSPIIEIAEISGGHRLTVTDVNGTESFDVLDGAPGKTAYQYAQDGGYTGTEAEFAAKLAKEIPEPYTLPVATADTLGGVKVGEGLEIDDGVLSVEPGGEYVLIEEVAIGAEGVSRLERTAEPDGTPYNFSAAMVTTCVLSGVSGDTRLTMQVINPVTGAFTGVTQNFRHDTYGWVSKTIVDLTNGVWEVRGYNGGVASNSSMAGQSSADGVLSSRDMPTIKLVRLTPIGEPMPVGTAIKIYGVRANA